MTTPVPVPVMQLLSGGFQLSEKISDIRALHDTAHHTDSCSTCFKNSSCIFRTDSANSVNRNVNSIDNRFQKRDSPAGESFFACCIKNMAGGNIGAAQSFGFPGICH